MTFYATELRQRQTVLEEKRSNELSALHHAEVAFSKAATEKNRKLFKEAEAALEATQKELDAVRGKLFRASAGHTAGKVVTDC